MFKSIMNFWNDEYFQTFCRTLSTKYQLTAQLLPTQTVQTQKGGSKKIKEEKQDMNMDMHPSSKWDSN
jgi:hypothetical protein